MGAGHHPRRGGVGRCPDAADAIDSWRRAAGGTTLRSESVVNRERTTFRWALCHDGGVDGDLLDELAAWRCEIGARRTIGLGRLVVDSVAATSVDLTVGPELTWWLNHRDRWLLGSGDDAAIAPPGEVVSGSGAAAASGPDEPSWTWRIVDPLHVGTGEFAADGEHPSGPPTPQRRTRVKDFRRAPSAGKGKPVRLEIPGSAWKGVFRHRVSSILRVGGATEDEVGAVVRVLFGHHGDRTPIGPLGERRRGRLQFRSSTVDAPVTLTRTHVAIDRISGGAAESKLFTVRSVPQGTASLRIDGVAGLTDPVRNLLHHVVWDIHEGLLGVGAFTGRGYGTLALTGKPPTTTAVDRPSIVAWAVAQLDSSNRPQETA